MNAHIDAIAAIAESYRQRGYQVEVEPAGQALPPFLLGFQPDLIARSPNENVVIEVKVGTRTSVADRLREVAERVNNQPGWRFSVVFSDPNNPGQIVEGETTPLPALEQRLESGRQLIQSGQGEAAFLLLWSTIEGVLRLLGDRAKLPLKNLPPSALIRELYSQGELNRQQFDTLMRELPLRNQLVHGLGSTVAAQPNELAAVAEALLGELKD
jgi:hypothetical protein